MSRIYQSTFRPFSTKGAVVKIQFVYNENVVLLLKQFTGTDKGGWLPEHRAWFWHPEFWPPVKEALEEAGHKIIEIRKIGDG